MADERSKWDLPDAPTTALDREAYARTAPARAALDVSRAPRYNLGAYRFYCAILMSAACVVATTSQPEHPGTAEPTPSNQQLRPVLMEAFEEDRGCWAHLTVDRPASDWKAWPEDLDGSCWNGSDRPERTDLVRSTADGHCVRFQGVRHYPDCHPIDPWIRPCAEVADCCDRMPGSDPLCNPLAYEP